MDSYLKIITKLSQKSNMANIVEFRTVFTFPLYRLSKYRYSSILALPVSFLSQYMQSLAKVSY